MAPEVIGFDEIYHYRVCVDYYDGSTKLTTLTSSVTAAEGRHYTVEMATALYNQNKGTPTKDGYVFSNWENISQAAEPETTQATMQDTGNTGTIISTTTYYYRISANFTSLADFPNKYITCRNIVSLSGTGAKSVTIYDAFISELVNPVLQTAYAWFYSGGGGTTLQVVDYSRNGNMIHVGLYLNGNPAPSEVYVCALLTYDSYSSKNDKFFIRGVPLSTRYYLPEYCTKTKLTEYNGMVLGNLDFLNWKSSDTSVPWLSTTQVSYYHRNSSPLYGINAGSFPLFSNGSTTDASPLEFLSTAGQYKLYIDNSDGPSLKIINLSNNNVVLRKTASFFRDKVLPLKLFVAVQGAGGGGGAAGLVGTTSDSEYYYGGAGGGAGGFILVCISTQDSYTLTVGDGGGIDRDDAGSSKIQTDHYGSIIDVAIGEGGEGGYGRQQIHTGGSGGSFSYNSAYCTFVAAKIGSKGGNAGYWSSSYEVEHTPTNGASFTVPTFNAINNTFYIDVFPELKGHLTSTIGSGTIIAGESASSNERWGGDTIMYLGGYGGGGASSNTYYGRGGHGGQKNYWSAEKGREGYIAIYY